MCPLYPLHILVLYCCLLLPVLLATVHGAENLAGWKLNFSTPSIGAGDEKLRELTNQTFEVLCFDCKQSEDTKYLLELRNEDPNIAKLYNLQQDWEQDETGSLQIDITGFKPEFQVELNVSGEFLGFSRVSAKVIAAAPPKKDGSISKAETFADADLALVVTRSKAKKTASKIFGYSVAFLISLAYINMGCALDLQVMKQVLLRPVGPAIGFVSQFLFMPLVAFMLSFIFPADMPEMRLGLFVTGCSPGGGASNIWTIMFNGNLDLSVTMTTVSTFSAFIMMPLWMFLLGEVIISNTDIVVPYSSIVKYGVLLVIPLTLGMLINRFLPRVSKLLVKILKPMALFLILFILVCGIWSQFFMIKLISWRIALVGFALPWLGFAFGCLFSKLCKRERKDIIAIAVETGVQNTGMAIFMLWFTLDHPAGDLAAVIPVAVATFTPVPLLFSLLYYRVKNKYCPASTKEDIEDLTKDMTPDSIEEQKLRAHKISEKGDTNMNTQELA